MRLGTLGAAVSGGVATALLVFVLVTESLSETIEFSALLGIPAGLVAGTITSAFVLRYAGPPGETDRRALARGLSVFGVTMLVAFGAGLLLIDASVTVVLVGATLLGGVTGTITALREHAVRGTK